MTFSELAKTRRSIRQYTDAPIAPELIEQITTAALMSPASKRSNPWEFIVVQERETLVRLSQSRPHGSQLLAGAPLGIVVIADTEKSDVWVEDASIAAAFIQLQAHDLGLGSCWVQIYKRDKEDGISSEDYIKEMLEIPDNFAVLCIISIGHKNEERNEHDLEKLAYNKIHQEKFIIQGISKNSKNKA